MNAIHWWVRWQALAAACGCRVDELMWMTAAEVQRRRDMKLGLVTS